jgi:hypothetical protein
MAMFFHILSSELLLFAVWDISHVFYITWSLWYLCANPSLHSLD